MNGASKLSEALNAHPAVLDYIIGLSPGEFDRLRNPFMRKVMPSRITLQRVALMAGVSESELVNKVNEIAGLPNDVSGPSLQDQLPGSPIDKPEWLRLASPTNIHWVDLLPVDAVLGDPMPAVSVAVNTMHTGDTVGIKHRWEPQPFYDIWYARGFEFWAERIDENLWHVYVHRPVKA